MVRPTSLWARRALGPVLGRAGVRFYDFSFGLRWIDEVPPPVEARVAAIVRPATAEELARVARGLDDAELARDVLRAVAAGSECVVAECEGRVAGFTWANLSRIDVAGELVCRLPPGAAYVHTVYVAPDLRGRRIMQLMARDQHLRLRDRGCSFTCRLVDRENAASIEGTARGGIRWQWAPIVKLGATRPFFVLGRPAALAAGARERAVTMRR